MRITRQGICLWVVLLGSFASLVHAASPEDEYRKLIRVNQDIKPLGEHPFGENVSLYDGSLSFTQTDISLSGSGPALQLIRRFEVYGNSPIHGAAEPVFGGWELEVPHLETLTAGRQPTADNPTGVAMWNVSAAGNLQRINGWQTDNTGDTSGSPSADVNARCTNFTAPPSVVRHLGDPDLEFWDPYDWWKGYHLLMPGEGGQDVLANADSATKSTYPAVTKEHWRFSCLPTTANGQPGEGFLGHAPDGTLYWFDYLVYRPADGMSRQLSAGDAGLSPPQSSFQRFADASVVGLISLLSGSSSAHAATVKDSIVRSLGVLLVTKVQDRFGNTLNYSYDSNGLLTGITASDGRALSVAYVAGTSRVQTVTLQPASGAPRVWLYTYNADGSSLVDVKLPDSSHWHYDMAALQSAMLRNSSSYSSCETLAVPTDLGPVTGTITHPSGLVGQFTLEGRKHGRSYVGEICRGMDTRGPSTSGSYSTFPKEWYSLTTTRVVFSGAGIPASTWLYQYSSPNDSWYTCTGSCPTTIWTDVVAPDGSTVRHIFSNRLDITESRLLRTEFYTAAAGTSTLLRSEDYGYAAPTTAPLPPAAGISFLTNVNVAQLTKYFPMNQRVITQDGDAYTWQAEAFDQYAQVTRTKRFSSISGQAAIEEAIAYRNDTNLWVLGLPLTVTNVSTGEVESSNTYKTSNDTLLSRARFGQTLMNYTFNGAGQLASFTDGNSHTTTLGNYKCGIPQAIGYPDGKSQTLSVDDFGQIASITDQAGHTTSYDYDSVGRITRITYPSGDEAAWLPTTYTYSFVTGTERGLPANHWRRTTTTGSANAVTYYDAMLRPVLSDSVIGTAVQASTLTTYDARGLKVFRAYPSATALTFTQTPVTAGVKGVATDYDALGRIFQTRQDSELGVLTTAYASLSGARQRVTDPKTKVTTTSYQVFDSPSYDAPVLVQAPEGITQAISRDPYGNPLSITQWGPYGTETNSLTKTFVYNGYHRLCRTDEPESGSEVMGYDGANNLTWSVTGITLGNDGSCHPELAQSASVTTRSYDAMNRLKTILPPVGTGTQSTSYDYDPVGRLTSGVSGISSWNGKYNYRGALISETLQLVGQEAWVIGYVHDAYGNLSMIHYPDGESVDYAPDALGRPTQAGGYATGVGYFPDGQIAQFAFANGTGYVAEQNARQLLRNFSYGAGSMVRLSEDLDYDANGNITSVTDLAGGPRNKSFGYDALNRLTSANATALWGNQSYTYDALNNLRTLKTGSQTSTYHYDVTNKLASITDGASTLASYHYDNRGNVIGKNATVLVFDQKNQLTQIVGGGSYAYDAAGRRVSKTVGGATTYYFYNQAGRLMFQWAPADALSTSFVYLGSKLVGDNEEVVLGTPATIGFDANPNNGNYTVSWGAVPGATGYLLQESADGGTWTTIYSGSTASKLLTGRAGGSYTYRAEGCVGTTCGAWITSATLGVRPAMPTVNVPGGTINGTYTVSWTASAGASGYDVQERLDGGSWVTIASSTAATAISRPGTASGSYTYQVSARNVYGTRGWAVSDAVTVDTTYGVIPAAPTGLTVPASSSNGSATLSWGASSLAPRYVVEQSGNAGTSWAGIYDGSGTGTAVSGLANGSYSFHVQACNTYGCSAWTPGNTVLVVTHPPGTAPTISTPANSSNGGYTVSWGAVGTATSYTLQEQVNGGAWSTIQTGSMTSKTISGKANGSYGYRVQACNVGGCGPWSSTGTTTVLLPPAVPASITVPATSSGSIAVNWAASATATSYKLQQRLGTGGWGGVYAGAATSSTRAVAASGSYTYQVQACNTSGCSAYKTSSAVTVTIPPATAPTLNVPANSSSGSYTVSWGTVTAATSYTLQEQVNSGSWATIQTGSATSRAISGKGNGSYGYRVQACNAGGCGPWSGTASTVVVLIPAVPTGLSAIVDVYDLSGVQAAGMVSPQARPYAYQLSATWNASAGATSYTLQYCQTGGTCGTRSGSATSVSPFTVVGAAYTVSVQACNASGCSPYGATVKPIVVQN
ncbi:MAG TPA: hypothetical protein VFN09_14030 [Rhodanobacteraceae bacterium]|jgi:YD repeat-containing protein|nr:hypothetical protein [Rhodanobacteraceae bacterium]